jgi:hypothetical protein
MSKSDDVLLAALVGAGIGALLVKALESNDRRAAFVADLRQKLKPHGFSLVAADLGRLSDDPTWFLTLETPSRSITTVNARVPPPDSADPYSEKLANMFADRITSQLRAAF